MGQLCKKRPHLKHFQTFVGNFRNVIFPLEILAFPWTCLKFSLGCQSRTLPLERSWQLLGSSWPLFACLVPLLRCSSAALAGQVIVIIAPNYCPKNAENLRTMYNKRRKNLRNIKTNYIELLPRYTIRNRHPEL